jgi:hypothetical protein
MKHLIIFRLGILGCLFLACNKDPYEPPAYSVKAGIIGEEICSSDSNYNYWLLYLLPGYDLPYDGDTIVYNGIEYQHVFKTLNLDESLKQAGKKASFKFNYAYSDYAKSQSSVCDASHAETFLLTDISLFDQKEAH